MIPRYARPAMTAIWEPESKYGIWLEIETLQPAGRQRMDAAAFVNGYGQQL